MRWTTYVSISVFSASLILPTVSLAQTKETAPTPAPSSPQKGRPNAGGTRGMQGMPPGMMDGMMRGMGGMPGMQGMAALLRDPEVKLSLTETPDGVIIQWSSKNPEKVKSLKEMAKRMKTVHEAQMQGAPSAPLTK